MFWPDIIEVRHFYETRLGQLVLRRLGESVTLLWPDMQRETIVGIGYSFPYLRLFNDAHMRNQLIAVTPTNMGVRHWPSVDDNKAIIAEEYALPLPNNSVNAALVVHALEFSDKADVLLQELWRVLVPGGRMCVVVPHRRSLWSCIETTPFGNGHPFTVKQIKSLLMDCCFVPLTIEPALFFPPVTSSRLHGALPLCDAVGKYMLRAVGGVLCVEAQKQLYAFSDGVPVSQKRRSVYVPVPEGVMPRV